MMALLGGSSVIYGPGMLEAGITFDLAQLVVDSELIAMTKYCRAGIPVNDATTAVEEIMAVGPAGHFLEQASTLQGMRGLSTTKLIDRQVREAWETAGSPDFYEKARCEARRILAEHEVEPLPDDVTEQMRAIVADADREVGSGG
jgi:trimethylamine---corrinoid protein Co-methyltransferase